MLGLRLCFLFLSIANNEFLHLTISWSPLKSRDGRQDKHQLLMLPKEEKQMIDKDLQVANKVPTNSN